MHGCLEEQETPPLLRPSQNEPRTRPHTHPLHLQPPSRRLCISFFADFRFLWLGEGGEGGTCGQDGEEGGSRCTGERRPPALFVNGFLLVVWLFVVCWLCSVVVFFWLFLYPSSASSLFVGNMVRLFVVGFSFFFSLIPFSPYVCMCVCVCVCACETVCALTSGTASRRGRRAARRSSHHHTCTLHPRRPPTRH